MKTPAFRKLLIVALLGAGNGALAADEPYLYGPVRQGEQLARIAWELRPDKTREGTWQMNAALYRANPKAFINGDLERLRPGAMLVVPADPDVRRIDPDLARRVAREPKRARVLLQGLALQQAAVEPQAAPPASASTAAEPAPPHSPAGGMPPADPALYGPVRPGAQLAQIAWELRPDKTRVGTWQMNAALYRANPRAFIDGDLERLRPGVMLVVPGDEEVRSIDPELARKVAREPKHARALLASAAPAPRPPAALTLVPAPVAAPAPASEVVTAKVVPAWTPEPAPMPAGKAPAPATPSRMGAAMDAAPAAERRRPDAEARAIPDEPEALPDPNRMTRLAPVAMPNPWQEYTKAPVPDRWRILNSLGVVPQNWWDPYNQNTFKADKPVRNGDEFFNISVISDTVYEPRRLPTPVGPQSTGGSGAIGIFGRENQWLLNQNLILALVYLKGDTTFRPPDWEYHLTPVFNFNRTVTEEDRAVNVDPERGDTRNDSFIGIQELFVDYHLRNVSDRFDFDSVRFGIQPLSFDFRGFLFQDNQLAARLFGTRDNNRWQYNLAWVRRLEKDTNSGLNAINRDLRNDDVFMFNLYRQDFPVLGFTSQGIVAYNRNREDGARFYDKNGFLARPFSIGEQQPIRYDVTYLGYNGDGHFGRLNLTVSSYLAVGEQNRSPFEDKDQDILAGFAAAEASFDQDWRRWRLSALWASGDSDPFDGQANGFDAIFENPIFAGADTSFWIRQGVPLIGGGIVAISQRNGVLNSLRHSKEHGQSNFINPGTILLGAGADFDLTPTFRLSFNLNHLWFGDSGVLEVARNQGSIDEDIGWDVSSAAIWRPFMTQNIVLRLSGSMLIPGDGYQDLFPDDDYPYSILGNFIFTY
ncbi:hypothetical protein D0B54_20955 [Solimonas sp. K1W22B-7]|uniref:FimV/HubP family polar landmark protein n=1 Tax=Solimonas sp. K1W22B-7 TaxID=2303331 RepID=UPI000E334A66|nr:FimV/HubP family polar landmark protein [Solimonas sp. K1W22B-7]AXQ30998.1 hypothetical protein D0B54_20955 [Solimonas sp. K1W22B-7]